MQNLQYPIGRYEHRTEISKEQLNTWIEELAAFPQQLRQAVANLSEQQLDTPYRPGGWTLRQVVHHLADSHLNAYIRFKLSITEDTPTIKPYQEVAWAECAEAKSGPVAISVDLVDSLHKRWVLFLQSLSTADFDRSYFHPEQQKTVALKNALGIYAWHGAHHLAHINLVSQQG